MRSKGIVKSVNGKTVTVSVIREGACGENCAACKGCKNRTLDVEAVCDFNVKPGDLVEISSDTGHVISAMLLVFLLPIALPIIVYIFAQSLGKFITCILTVLALLFSLFIIYLLSRSEKYLQKLKASVISVIYEI